MSGRGESIWQQFSQIPTYRRKELLILSGYLLGILICAGWVATMLSRAYWNRGFFYESRWIVTNSLNLSDAALPALFIGFFLGLTSLVVLDWYKRVQGVLLMLGVFVASIALIVFRGGAVITTLPWLEGITPLLLVGAGVLGVIAGSVDSDPFKKPRKFPWVFPLLQVYIGFFLLIGIIDAHILYQSPITTHPDYIIFIQSFEFQGFLGGDYLFADAGFSAGLFVLFWRFAGHDTGKRVIVLGPTGSGKTWLLTGLGHVITQEWGKSGFQTDPQGMLRNMMNKFAHKEFDDNIFMSTIEARYLWFTYPHGVFFRKEIGIQTLDYPGNALRHVSTLDSEDVDVSNMEEALVEAEQASSPAAFGEELSKAIYYSDAIVTLVPLDDYGAPIEQRGNVMYDQDEINRPRDRMDAADYITKYGELATFYEAKDFVPVVTKADLAVKDFITETHYDTVLGNYQPFRDHIRDEVIGEAIDHYLNDLGEDNIYPVYFEVDEEHEEGPFTDSGNIRPRLSTLDTQPVVRGSIELLQRIGE